MKKISIVLLTIFATAVILKAQGYLFDTSGNVVRPGDIVNNAIRANIVQQAPITPCYIKSGTGTTNDNTNHANCKSTSATYLGGRALNLTGTNAYLKLYNLATDASCGTATGFVETIPIPASATGWIDIFSDFTYSAGLAYCVVGGNTNTDNSAPPAGVFITLGYN